MVAAADGFFLRGRVDGTLIGNGLGGQRRGEDEHRQDRGERAAYEAAAGCEPAPHHDTARSTGTWTKAPLGQALEIAQRLQSTHRL